MPIINPIYKIPIDPNLTAENLKAGVTIYPGTPYEVTGTLEGVTAPTLVRRTLEVGDILPINFVLYVGSLPTNDDTVIVSIGADVDFIYSLMDENGCAYVFYGQANQIQLWGNDGAVNVDLSAYSEAQRTVTAVYKAKSSYSAFTADLPEL